MTELEMKDWNSIEQLVIEVIDTMIELIELGRTRTNG